ncbi:MAG: cytochrome c [Rhizobiaceae bacterium]|nr:cytochrome c [Rhizobiaceae bacterium]
MKRLMKWFLAAVVLGLGVFWWLSEPRLPLESGVGLSELTDAEPDLTKGERIFWAGGCASCHAKKGASGDDKLLLGGGHRLDTPFGTFVTPNISPDKKNGIGEWSLEEFAVAMLHGVSPDGAHYYPSFPYNSYRKMQLEDVSALYSYLMTLQPVARENEPHELGIFFSWRRSLGIWKRLFSNHKWAVEVDDSNSSLVRGRYLVEVLGHCGECHTPRNVLGGLETGSWLAGGPAPEGLGKIPNITPDENGIGSWSDADIAYYLESGFTPDFDSVGGSMTSVQQNFAKLPKEDREAVAAYLKSIPPISSK